MNYTLESWATTDEKRQTKQYQTIEKKNKKTKASGWSATSLEMHNKEKS